MRAVGSGRHAPEHPGRVEHRSASALTHLTRSPPPGSAGKRVFAVDSAAMSRLLTLFSLLFVLGTALSPAHAEKPRIAVLELQGTLAKAELNVVSDRVRKGVLNGVPAGSYVVLSRETMVAFLKAEGADPSCLEGECEWKVGQMMGAAYVISGSVVKMGGGLVCTLKVHETTGGELLATDVVQVGQSVELISKVPGPPFPVLVPPFREYKEGVDDVFAVALQCLKDGVGC